MRQVVVLVAVLAIPLVVADSEPQIADPQGDAWFNGNLESPEAGVPDPATDILAVSFLEANSDLVVEIRLSDVDHRPAYWEYYRYSINIGTDLHNSIHLAAEHHRLRGWGLDVVCRDGGAITCTEPLESPTPDRDRNTLTLRAPTDLIGHCARSPIARGYTAYSALIDQPNARVQDRAPDQGTGRDYCPG